MLQAILQEYRSGNSHIVLEIPLLYESLLLPFICYPIIVVYVTEERIQKERLMRRNGLSDEEAEKRMRSQMSLKSKVSMSHIALCNDTSPESMNQELISRLPFYFSH